ncbi:MAG TPA: hypothetical protein VJ617_21075 [Arthrobacter sp.]|nr:hypothetical protein [Arthrobacter sp.]
MTDERKPTRDEAIAAAKTHAEWTKAWKMTPEGITDHEWQVYQNSDLRSMNKFFREKVEKAMGWKEADVAEAQEIADRVTHLVQKLDREAPPILARLRAALRLLENEHITPQGRRIIEKILDEEEGKRG